MRRAPQLLAGVAIAALGAVLVIAPGLVRDLLGRAPATPSDWINLRATFGGTLLGVGAFVAWLPARRPWLRAGLGLLGWGMAGVGVARLVGFALDGSPDSRQYVWLIAEIVLVAASVFALRRGRWAPA
jgi:hypothetical protein